MLKACAKIKIEINLEKEECEMCQAWDDQRAEGYAEGRADSIKDMIQIYIETCLEFGINDKVTILTKLRQKFKNLSESEAEMYVTKYALQ